MSRTYYEFDADLFRSARSRLQEVLRDSRLEPVHHAAKQLLDFLSLRLEPARRMRELSLVVTTPNNGGRIRQAWIDYDYLLDQPFAPVANPAGGVEGRIPTDDLGLWMTVVRGRAGRDSREIAMRRWRDTATTHWLFAALSLADGQSADADQLTEAATRIPATDPAYLSITLHRLRLAIERGQTDAARDDLDSLLANSELAIPIDVRNQFQALRFSVSRSLEEALRFAPRRPLNLDSWGAQPGSEWYLDEDATVLLNYDLPLGTLEQIVRQEILPDEIRRELALTTWVRAALIGETAVAMRLLEQVQTWWPELRSALESYRKSSPGERNFALTLLLLRHPGLVPSLRESLHRNRAPGKIDDLRNNWWCQVSRRPGKPPAPP